MEQLVEDLRACAQPLAAPVYRGSYPGLLKHLFDLIDLNALVNTPVQGGTADGMKLAINIAAMLLASARPMASITLRKTP